MRGRSRWRQYRDEPQVANAYRGVFPLPPASETPAEVTRARWQPLLPDQEVPLIWEKDRHGREEPSLD